MRVEHTQVDDFFADVEADAQDVLIWQNIIRVRIDEIDEQPEGISQAVQIWMTYIREPENEPGNGYIVGIGLHCGSTADMDGNARAYAKEINNRLEQLASQFKIKLRPGKIEFA